MNSYIVQLCDGDVERIASPNLETAYELVNEMGLEFDNIFEDPIWHKQGTAETYDEPGCHG